MIPCTDLNFLTVASDNIFPRFEASFILFQGGLKDLSCYYLDTPKVTPSRPKVVEPELVEENHIGENRTGNGTEGVAMESGETTGMELIPFEYEGGIVRVIKDLNGVLWWVAKDVAMVLGYADSSNPARLFGHVPNEWKGLQRIHTPGGTQEMLCLNEQGLYFFLGRSDKPGALPLQKWVAGDGLPTIRKHGIYATPATMEAMLEDPDNASDCSQL
jgi:prophage antirepressor-like protein